MKKWILYLLFLVHVFLSADKNNDDFQLHAQSWVLVQNQKNYSGYREYINSVDGIRCRVVDGQDKQTFTTYNSLGQKIDSFDYFYGNSTESWLLSSCQVQKQNGSLQNNNEAQQFGSTSSQHNSAVAKNQQFIAEREHSKSQNRIKSFNNEQTRDQEIDLLFLNHLISFDDVQAYYQAKVDYNNYLEQQKIDQLQSIKDRKNLVQRHEKEWSDLQRQHTTELHQEKNKDKFHTKQIKARHKQDNNNLLLKQYDENPTFFKGMYLVCKKVKDRGTSVFGTDYSPAPAPDALHLKPKNNIPVTAQQIEQGIVAQDIASINNFQQKKIIETQTILQNLHNEYCHEIQNSHHKSQEFQQIMHSRSEALIESLQNQTITTQTVQLKNETIGFMQAHNIDSTIFTQSSGLAINHQISHEMIDVMDQLAYHASHHFNNDFIQKGSLICSEMATTAQQENHLNHTSESMSAANCSHGLLHYVKGMASDSLQRCDQMLQALDYYTLEMNKYVISAAKGVAQGIITAEIATVTMSALGSVASTCAPALTATISSCASAAAAPIACAAAVVATTVIVGETTQLGYFYATDQMNKFNTEMNRVKDFAAKFYDFNQTKYEHVENISQAATTLLWPVKSQAIIDSLQGICNAQVHFYVQGKKVIEKTARVSQDILESAIKKVNSLEFKEFNASYKKIFGQHLFEFSAPPQVALAGISETFVEKEMVSLIPTTNLFNESTNKVTEKIIGGIVTQVAQNSADQQVVNKTKSIVTKPILITQAQEIIKVQEILAAEIASEMSKTSHVFIDLTTPINSVRAAELAQLSSNIRQLQDLAKYTHNFTNLDNLILEDILYLNRIYELQPYRAQIKKFLDTHKPFFVHEGQRYYIEDISSYHIHAGDLYLKDRPDGCHSNYGGNKFTYFNPELAKNGPLGTKDITLHNPRKLHQKRKSSMYPEAWSEYLCDIKAIQVLINQQSIIKFSQNLKSLEIIGYTSEGLEIKIFYDILNKRIKSHYPNLEMF